VQRKITRNLKKKYLEIEMYRTEGLIPVFMFSCPYPELEETCKEHVSFIRDSDILDIL